jgi:uncharacterized protein (TIGR00251 family)
MLSIIEKDTNVIIKVKVQPGASKTEIVGELDGMLKLRIAAPPVDGKANEECRRFLAAMLKVSASSVHIRSGRATRVKTVTVSNITAEHARTRLCAATRAADSGKC